MAAAPHGFPTPKYRAVTAYLSELLGELAEGAPIPAERELAVRLNVARETVRQAIRELVVAGRLRREGRATVVAGPKLVQPLALASYTEGIREAGRRPGRAAIALGRLDAEAPLAEALDIGLGDPVAHLERVLLCDDQPVGLENTYLPLHRFPGVLDEFDPTTSLYAYIEGCGVRFATATEQIETMLASPREARLLRTNPALPMLHLNRLSRDAAGRPIERVRSLFRGDRFSFTTTLYAP